MLRQDGIGMLRFVEEVMLRHNDYRVAQATITRWLTALRTGKHDSIREEPSLQHLQQAERIMFLSATMEVTAYICTPGGQDALRCITPVWSQERKLWVTQGHMRHALQLVLGVEELPIVLPTSRLAYLFMDRAHKLDHHGPKQMLARSRSWLWIPKGQRLAAQVERD